MQCNISVSGFKHGFLSFIVCRTFEPYMAIPPFYLFSEPPLLARLFQQYCPNEILDKHKNKLMWQSYCFIFRRLKNNVTCFFIKKILRFNPK